MDILIPRRASGDMTIGRQEFERLLLAKIAQIYKVPSQGSQGVAF